MGTQGSDKSQTPGPQHLVTLMLSPTVSLAQELIVRRSITPRDAGCQGLIAQRLRGLGFEIEQLGFGEVSNLWARRGQENPVFTFAGHTDVVPAGPETDWRFPPFTARIDDGMLHGRGAADMKGSLAAMVTACERFISRHPEHRGSVSLLITSDEEGEAKDGTAKVVDTLQARNQQITWCVVGEPTSHQVVGDVIKNGRRGSLTGHLRALGRAGHVAYPQRTDNPIHHCGPLIRALASCEWDRGNDFFPSTSFQISNIGGGTGAGNMVPGHVDIQFNFRFSSEVSHSQLQSSVAEICDRHLSDYRLDWTLFGKPFLTPPGELISAVSEAIQETVDIKPELSTDGGTSDGRFIAPTGAQVIELGPVNATIHQTDEHVRIADLDDLSAIYEKVLKRLLT